MRESGLAKRRSPRYLPTAKLTASPIMAAMMSSNDEQQCHRMNVHAAQRGNAAGGKQEGIAGQEWRYHQAGFAKDDGKENGIDPGAVLCAEFA